MKKSAQQKLRILIADSDTKIGRIIVDNLQAMGIGQVAMVRNGTEAIDHLAKNPVDIMITEWLMSPVDGIELVTYIRRNEQSPKRALPIIMLTGKGEKTDVEKARDAGITEFLVKPFTTKSLYHRIEQLVDHPRGFVFAPNYIGPDRRRRDGAGEGSERRSEAPRTVVARPGIFDMNFQEPTMIAADHALKRVMELPAPLATVITPSMLAAAQQRIDDMQSESMAWIIEDLDILEQNVALMEGEPRPQYQDELEQAAMQIKSRGGTFGFMLASNIARLLYLFLTTKYERWKVPHNLAVRKHIEALKVTITSNAEIQQAIAAELLQELELLVKRL